MPNWQPICKLTQVKPVEANPNGYFFGKKFQIYLNLAKNN